MAGKTSANNGRLGGRPPGRKNDKTLMLEEEHKAFQQIVLEQLRPLVQAQLMIAKGTAHVYRIDIGPRGGRSDPTIVTDPDELFDAIRAIDAGDGHGDIAEEAQGEAGTEITHRYYSISTKSPDGKAIDSLIDRVFGKSVQRIGGGDGGSVQIQGVEITFKK